MPTSHPVRLHVEDVGEGPPILLAHGFAGSARNFRPQVRALRGAWRIITYDARGHARSEAPEGAAYYTLDALVEDMMRVLDERGIEAAIVGGLSMGAAVALQLALRAPERVRGLVLAAYPAGKASGLGMAPSATDFADDIERRGLDAAGESWAWGPKSGLDPAAARLVRLGFLEHPPHALAHILREVLDRLPGLDELAPHLSELRTPSLVLVGEHDRGSQAACQQLVRCLPEVGGVEIEGAGHVVNLQAPDAFNAALSAWLEARLIGSG